MIEVAKIKSLAKRINALMDERDGILADIRDIYAEAKSHEIVPKVLRKVIARQRAKDPAALILEDDLLDTYLAALDGPTRRAVEMAASGATAREIEAETGIDQATAARSVSLKKKRETNPAPINPEEGGAPNPVRDGEASADERDASASSSPPTRAEIAQVANKVAINAGEVSIEAGGSIFAESANNESCGGVEGHAGRLLAPNCQPGAGEQSQPGETLKDRKAAGTPAMAASGTAGVESGPQDLSAEAPQKVGAGDPPPEGSPSLYQRITGAFHDPLDFPPHLDRRASRGEG